MALCFVSSSQILSWSKIIKSKRRDLASLNYQKQQGVGSGNKYSGSSGGADGIASILGAGLKKTFCLGVCDG